MTEQTIQKAENLAPVDIWDEFSTMEEFDGQREELLPFLLEPGTRRDILVISGENAGGKSLAISIINQLGRTFAEQDGLKLEVMDVGMSARTTSDIMRSFVFGDENTDSTGNISIKVIQGGVSTSRERKNFHYLILDEPDIGVGEGYHKAMGQYLASYAVDLPKNCLGFVVASHSRRLVNELIAMGASSLRVGADLRPVRTWIEKGDIEKSVEDLLALKDIAIKRFRDVRSMLYGGSRI
jgi:hypothetical protein